MPNQPERAASGFLKTAANALRFFARSVTFAWTTPLLAMGTGESSGLLNSIRSKIHRVGPKNGTGPRRFPTRWYFHAVRFKILPPRWIKMALARAVFQRGGVSAFPATVPETVRVSGGDSAHQLIDHGLAFFGNVSCRSLLNRISCWISAERSAMGPSPKRSCAGWKVGC